MAPPDIYFRVCQTEPLKLMGGHTKTKSIYWLSVAGTGTGHDAWSYSYNTNSLTSLIECIVGLSAVLSWFIVQHIQCTHSCTLKWRGCENLNTVHLCAWQHFQPVCSGRHIWSMKYLWSDCLTYVVPWMRGYYRGASEDEFELFPSVDYASLYLSEVVWDLAA